MTNTARLVGYLCGADILGLFILLGVALHLAYTKMDTMLSHLNNCPAVMVREPFKNGGPWGRLFLLSGIIGVVTAPHIYLRDGGASAEDLMNFPALLKRRLILIKRGAWGLLCAMGAFVLLYKIIVAYQI
ncbi:hypothetical protein [Pseudomonas sp. BF-B-26]|jgi:hypothetical protein|uniref:hypothetical protein n=1 Tax=Pseudomonas sp. BF-B-26 TaxID=2832400 RepID=UPI001CC180B2|nr:hypothetical protein [Pseudomonas sp. BF-B-26]